MERVELKAVFEGVRPGGCVQPYLEGFAAELISAGYAKLPVRDYVRSAAHRGRWLDWRKLGIERLGATVIAEFAQHECECPLAWRRGQRPSSKPLGVRDRAVLLLMVRLGLRAGDIMAMRLDDLDWEAGTVRVLGKGRRQVSLPLPQDAGEALMEYLVKVRPTANIDHVFLCTNAPVRPIGHSSTVSGIVHAALQCAGIVNAPSKGAHLLRHSAATAMLRSGASLDVIATVLRHQSTDTTAYYAKVDIQMLSEIAQPWPEPTKERRTAHIYTREEIGRLLAAAAQLTPKGSLRPVTYVTLLSLLATTGLRISEALSLQLDDLRSDGLLIQQTEFRKSRLVPLHSTTREGLQRYVTRRKRVGSSDRALFISMWGTGLALRFSHISLVSSSHRLRRASLAGRSSLSKSFANQEHDRCFDSDGRQFEPERSRSHVSNTLEVRRVARR